MHQNWRKIRQVGDDGPLLSASCALLCRLGEPLFSENVKPAWELCLVCPKTVASAQHMLHSLHAVNGTWLLLDVPTCWHKPQQRSCGLVHDAGVDLVTWTNPFTLKKARSSLIVRSCMQQALLSMMLREASVQFLTSERPEEFVRQAIQTHSMCKS